MISYDFPVVEGIFQLKLNKKFTSNNSFKPALM